MAFLEWTFYGNTLRAWITALLVAGAVFTLLEVVKGLVARRFAGFSERTASELDDLVTGVLNQTKTLWLALVAVFVASKFLYLTPGIDTFVGRMAIIALCVQGAIWSTTALDAVLRRYVDRQAASDPNTATTIGLLGFIGRVAIWALFLLFTLSNLGVEVTALVTGLGISGVAVALAVQNILGDLFSSLSIALDKPFVIGDFIVVGDLSGTVEHVGLKTTRVRSLSGEQIIFSNSDLLQSRIRNYKRMYERRVVFSFGVTYRTPHEKLACIPEIVREIIEAREPVRFDRAHFHRIGASSFDFEVVYHVRDPDYNLYMDIQQAINLALIERFEEEEIDFACPTQILHVSHVGAESSLPAGGSD